MNSALLAREAAAERGALDPREEPPEDLSKPTRLMRVVENEKETWMEYPNHRIVFEVGLGEETIG